MKRFLIICLLLVAVSVPAPVSAFVDRNDVNSAAQFKDYVPASYLKKAGITDDMTVDQALDKYITYALGFSDKTSYAYIASLSNPEQVRIRAGGSMAPSSRGDVVAGGWDIEVGDGARIVIRYPGGVTHTITGLYTYTVPAYGEWGSTAIFDMSTVNQRATSTDTTGKNQKSSIPDNILEDPIGWFNSEIQRMYENVNPAINALRDGFGI